MMRFYFSMCVLLLLSSCYMVEGKPTDEGAARSRAYQTALAHKVTSQEINRLSPALVAFSEANQHKLSATLASLMGHYVPLSTMAFVNNSQIRLERKGKDPLGKPALNGRLLAKQAPVIIINLTTDGSACYLIHSQAKRLILVAGLVCQPQ